ncbi:hypothetical protein UFOVP326_42 [uncultured Caudovirales phage]|uniref:Uncharacterized protein n=1 Tax=uncultured Caudovirales phage TaxID=2100421 RepID=A0A6J5LXT8_9CAUD|nr:hypothetical protein UFOVP326_42 [uncultured Caudovirales phage]
MSETPSYHDLHITTAEIARTPIYNLPFSVQVKCNRVGGWEVWEIWDGSERLLGGEYAGPENGLRLDVAGRVIVDSLSPKTATVAHPAPPAPPAPDPAPPA